MRKRKVAVAAWSMAALLSGSAAAQDVSERSRSPEPGDVPIILTIIESAAARRPAEPARFVVAARNVSSQRIVAWGADVLERDRKARLRPIVTYGLRPAVSLADSHAVLEGFAGGGPRPAFEARATFAVFEDGSWAGNGTMARREIASMRDEYVAARSMAVVLGDLPAAPDRGAVRQASLALVRAHASARSHRTRRLNDSILRTLAMALDPEMLADRTVAQMVDIARGAVARQLSDLERLTFVTRP